jgi:hypothetical protein
LKIVQEEIKQYDQVLAQAQTETLSEKMKALGQKLTELEPEKERVSSEKRSTNFQLGEVKRDLKVRSDE